MMSIHEDNGWNSEGDNYLENNVCGNNQRNENSKQNVLEVGHDDECETDENDGNKSDAGNTNDEGNHGCEKDEIVGIKSDLADTNEGNNNEYETNENDVNVSIIEIPLNKGIQDYIKENKNFSWTNNGVYFMQCSRFECKKGIEMRIHNYILKLPEITEENRKYKSNKIKKAVAYMKIRMENSPDFHCHEIIDKKCIFCKECCGFLCEYSHMFYATKCKNCEGMVFFKNNRYSGSKYHLIKMAEQLERLHYGRLHIREHCSKLSASCKYCHGEFNHDYGYCPKYDDNRYMCKGCKDFNITQPHEWEECPRNRDIKGNERWKNWNLLPWRSLQY